ncbi:hypothetical protein LSCM1_03491 [Leishmania martiniquensis]|uniref:ethanolamine kinase n=1 Tax=Leishmania martiniquensis TaxID=1580590 RepID=A0A836HEP0_9TRYP|nr:hypothetical protein LSCM1_03491 [Leishmania martiniquensis]
MAEITDEWITDDPLRRQVQITEVVLTHCASVLWRQNREKLNKATGWAATLRAWLRSNTEGLDSNSSFSESSVSQRPIALQKRQSDVTLVLADVFAPMGSSKPNQPPHNLPALSTPSSRQSFHIPSSHKNAADGAVNSHLAPEGQSSIAYAAVAHGATLTNTNTLSRSSTCSSTGWPRYPEVGAGNNRVCEPRTGPSPPVVAGMSSLSRRSTEEICEECCSPPTPVTTRLDEAAVLKANASPSSECRGALESPFAPLQVKRLSGGITNELFHVYDADNPSASVVVRVFGKETDRVISRESELFYQSLFIPTYVHGGNFLVYDYLDGYYALPYQDMPAEAMTIARAIAAFQVRATRAALRDHACPLLRDSHNMDYWKSLEEQMQAAEESSTTSSCGAHKIQSRYDRESNYVIDSLTKWVNLILSQEIVDKVHVEKRESFLETGRRLQSECAWMVSMLEGQKAFLLEGVCHNDLLSANIMIHRERQDVQVIDFDYTKRSFLLYDVANHFNEYPGLDCDYDTHFPSDAHMSAFIAEYRRGMREALEAAWSEKCTHANSTTGASREDQIFPNARELFWSDSEEAEAKVVAHWTRLAKLLTLASHLSWSVWSLLQEAVSALDVDFLDYARVRYSRYLAVRDECSEKL